MAALEKYRAEFRAGAGTFTFTVAAEDARPLAQAAEAAYRARRGGAEMPAVLQFVPLNPAAKAVMPNPLPQ